MERIETNKTDVKKIESNLKQLQTSKKVTKAVILAGGLGTRFLPGTLVVAKELFPILGKPILLYHLEELSKAGIKDVLIVGNYLKEESFKNFLNPPQEYLEKIELDGKIEFLKEYNDLMNKFDSICYINQEIGSQTFMDKNDIKNEVRGSSIAVLAAMSWVGDDPFLVSNGDDLCIYDDGKSAARELVDVFERTGDYVIYGKEVSRDQIYKYSSMVLGETDAGERGFKMKDIIEKPAKGSEPSNIMGFARYIFTPDVFKEILISSPRANGEFCITDVISKVAKEGRASAAIFDGNYFDCGSYVGFQMAGNYFLAQTKDGAEKLFGEIEKLKKSDKFFSKDK